MVWISGIELYGLIITSSIDYNDQQTADEQFWESM